MNMLILFIIFIVIGILIGLWIYVFSFYWNLRKAKKLIERLIIDYKFRCNGSNRFLVSIPILQDMFVQFDTDVIESVFYYLIEKGIIVRDELDGEWCIK